MNLVIIEICNYPQILMGDTKLQGLSDEPNCMLAAAILAEV
jgi:hypothetical protein